MNNREIYKSVTVHYNDTNESGVTIYSVKEIRELDDYIEVLEFLDEEDEKLGVETITRIPRNIIKEIEIKRFK